MFSHLWLGLGTVEWGLLELAKQLQRNFRPSYAAVSAGFDAGHPFLSASLAWCQSISAVLTIKVHHLTRAHLQPLLWLPGGQTECNASCIEK